MGLFVMNRNIVFISIIGICILGIIIIFYNSLQNAPELSIKQGSTFAETNYCYTNDCNLIFDLNITNHSINYTIDKNTCSIVNKVNNSVYVICKGDIYE